PLGIDLGAFASGRTFLNGAPITPGGGVAVSLALDVGRFRPMLTVVGDYHGPFEVAPNDRLYAVQVQTLSLRALLSLDVVGGDAFRVDVGLGAGADGFSSKTMSELPQQWLKQHIDVDPVITLMVTGRLAIASSVDIYLAAAVDFDTWPLQLIGTI